MIPGRNAAGMWGQAVVTFIPSPLLALSHAGSAGQCPGHGSIPGMIGADGLRGIFQANSMTAWPEEENPPLRHTPCPGHCSWPCWGIQMSCKIQLCTEFPGCEVAVPQLWPRALVCRETRVITKQLGKKKSFKNLN